MAYAAFRMGQCALCLGMNEHDPAEKARLGDAVTLYRNQVTALMHQTPPDGGDNGA
jgi:hypothetical protein